MGVQEQVFKWVQGLDDWKQELFLRASAAPELSDEDVREVTSMLLGEQPEGGGPRLVTEDDFPGATRGEEPMAVHSLGELQNVNALADGQTLTFEPAGLNVVYGKNGAGKTGYSRVLKHAGRTLHRETVLTNLASGDESSPRATVTVSIGDDDAEPVGLDLEQPGPGGLGRICIADEQSCDVYLTTDTEVDYAPVMLTNLKRFRNGLEGVDGELSRRRAELEPADLDLSPFAEGTAARALLGDLGAATAEAVTALASLAEEEQERLAVLRRKRGEIEAAQAPKLRAAAEAEAAAGRRLAADLGKVATALGEEAVWEAKQRQVARAELRKAADLAAKQFGDEPLPGVGSDPWRHLWEAANDYVTHLEDELGGHHDPDRCPYCMQELSREARERLARFGEFVKSDVNAKLSAAVDADREAREALPDPAAVAAAHAGVLDRMGREEGDVGRGVVGWLEVAEGVYRSLREGELADDLAGVKPTPLGVREWIEAREKEAAEHAVLERGEENAELLRELAELEARKALAERLPAVLSHLAAEAKVRKVDAARSRLGKTEASNRMTKLSRELVENELQEALNRQLQALGFRGLLEIEAKASTPKGTPKVGLRLKTVHGVPLTDVLSKGEQRRLALAMFLAEMEVVADPSPVVLDDPVTSIDQEGRRHIARSLAALADRRQVIVFTHELSFVHELQRAAAEEVGLHIQHVRRIADAAGFVSDELPWQGLKAKHRAEPLQRKIKSVQELYEAGEDDQYRREASEICMLLRQAFERAVEEEVLGGVITRRDDTVHATALRKVALNDQICELVDRGVADNSPWVHDQPLADGGDPPNPEELRNGLEVFEDLLAALKAYRSGPGGDGGGPRLEEVRRIEPLPDDGEETTLRSV